MEDVVGSVFDLMGRTSDPILEEEVINSRVDYIFEVKFYPSNEQVLQVEIVLNVLAFTSNKMEILRTTKILFKSKCIKVVQSTMMAFMKRAPTLVKQLCNFWKRSLIWSQWTSVLMDRSEIFNEFQLKSQIKSKLDPALFFDFPE